MSGGPERAGSTSWRRGSRYPRWLLAVRPRFYLSARHKVVGAAGCERSSQPPADRKKIRCFQSQVPARHVIHPSVCLAARGIPSYFGAVSPTNKQKKPKNSPRLCRHVGCVGYLSPGQRVEKKYPVPNTFFVRVERGRQTLHTLHAYIGRAVWACPRPLKVGGTRA